MGHDRVAFADDDDVPGRTREWPRISQVLHPGYGSDLVLMGGCLAASR